MEGSALEAQESYTSLRQEVEIKTKKLKKLYAKLQMAKAEIQDLQDVNASERVELEQAQMELTREFKLRVLILENFIPHEEKKKIEDRTYFDEDEGIFRLKPLSETMKQTMMKRPQSAMGSGKRPVSQYAKLAAAVDILNPRFRSENILLVELDMPTRTTRDYEGPLVAPKVQAALDAALQEESELQLDAGADIFALKPKKKSKTRVKSAKPRNKSSKANQDASAYPTSRGLIPK